MGNSSSSAADDEDPMDPFDGIDTLGYRVLGVQPGSPAAAAGLVSFLDFLVGCDGKMLLGSGEDLEPGMEYDDVDLPALLEENKGKELEFLVWNIKSQEARLVHLTPSDDWGGAGLLGVTIRLDNYAGAEDRLVRVLSVEPGSPAAIAGLVPEKDFLLGTTHQTLSSVDHLAVAVLQENIDRVVELYVYNSESDVVRVVALMPTYRWGDGRGLLGAEVGTGYLHRLPFTSRGTAGSSVERKVRYVASNDPTAATILENEPQLEMEPAGSDEEGDEVESVALETPEKVMHKTSEMAVAPASTPEWTVVPRALSSAGVPRAPSSAGLDPKEVQAIFEKPPPAPEQKPGSNGQASPEETPPPQHQSSPQLQYQASPPQLKYQASVPQQLFQAPQERASQSEQQYAGASQVQQQPPYQANEQQQYQAPTFRPNAVPAQQFPPAPANFVNTYAAAPPPGAKYASSAPLGPPPQVSSYGASAAATTTYAQAYGSAAQSAYSSSNVPVAAPPAAYSYGSASSLPPPPVGIRGQQPLFSISAPLKPPPPQYST